MNRALAAVTVALALSPARVHACTLWGAAGAAAAGGTIVSKNRDWKPDHAQVLRMRRGEGAHAYFALCIVRPGTSGEPGIAAGVNDKGLSVFTAAAGSVPKRLWEKSQVKRSFTGALLSGYASCDELLAKKDEIFPSLRPAFIMIADRHKILMVEVGIERRYALKTVEDGPVAHTNHFLEEPLADLNIAPGEGSRVRLERITHLLQASHRPFTLDSFAAMSRDRHDGPDNSLWRTGKVARTLASWIVETPAQGVPRLRVVIANPGGPERTHTFVLDEKFWRETK